MPPYIQTVPLPRFRRSLCGFKARRELLGDSWRVSRDHQIEFFPRGSRAFVDAAKGAARDPEKPVCFFPSYFCEGSLKPLRQAGARIVFYRLTRDLTPDWGDVQQCARAKHPDLFILVHTFGLIQDAADARAFAEEEGCLLLEDAAHVLMPGGSLGSGGTIVLFSPHKLLALPPISLLSIPNSLAGRFRSLYRTAWRRRDWKWLARRLIQKGIVALGGLGIQAKARGEGFADDKDGTPSVINYPHEISRLGSWLLGADQRDLAEIARRRREHFAFLARVVAEVQDVAIPHPFAEWPEDAVPYAFPFFVGEDRVSGVYAALWKLGVPVQTWPDLPPEVRTQPDLYPETLFWRRNLLLLPVHQSLTSQQMDMMISGLHAVLIRTRPRETATVHS